MYATQDELSYEEKMDLLSDYLEDLLLDAMIAVFRKILERNREFKVSNPEQEEILF
jgi:hypothetical protein